MSSTQDPKKKPDGSTVLTTQIPQPTTATPAAPTADVLQREANFDELFHQCTPHAEPGTFEASQSARLHRDYTARRFMHLETANDQVTRTSTPADLLSGPQPQGKAAEVVTARRYRDVMEGKDPRMVNAPAAPANMRDVRLAADNASARDLIYQVELSDGRVLAVPGIQVKTGGSAYVADTLCEMASRSGAGTMAVVDQRFVNPDGSPRIAADAFTATEGSRVKAAGVTLRGCQDLEKEAGQLVCDVRSAAEDGLTPAERFQRDQRRAGIQARHAGKGLAGRVAGSVAMGAATGAVITLVHQAITGQELDPTAVAKGAGQAAATGALAAGGETATYHLARAAGQAPEVAQATAHQVVAGAFTALAVGADAIGEYRAYKRGEVSAGEAAIGTGLKTVLDLSPLVLGPAAPLAIPLQLGGRWLLAKRREVDALLDAEAAALRGRLDAAGGELSALAEQAAGLTAQGDEIDALLTRSFARVSALKG